MLAGLTFLGVDYTIGENSPAFLQWGWRVPFLISAALIVIALYVRLNIEETPVFSFEKAKQKAGNLNPARPCRKCCGCSAARSCWPPAAC